MAFTISSTSNSNSWDQKVSAFLAYYKLPETRDRFEELVTLTKEECEKLLEDISIKGVVQGRTKKNDSLEKKLEDLEMDLRNWVSEGKEIHEHDEMGDLAGVRITLYFPDDVPKVAQKIEEHFDRKRLFGTVRDERDTTQGRNVHIQKYLNGPWHSRGPNGTDEHWEHYGYKSWQIVVEWKEPLPERLNSLIVRMPEGRKSLRVEIQVVTMMAQAWAEVEHDIIYKRPADVSVTSNMTRMIDAINGQAITTDIMLRELDQTVKDAKKNAEAIKVFGERGYKTMNDCLENLATNYKKSMQEDGHVGVEQAWFDAWHKAKQTLEMCRQPGPIPRITSTDFTELMKLYKLLVQLYGTRIDAVDIQRDLDRTRRAIGS